MMNSVDEIILICEKIAIDLGLKVDYDSFKDVREYCEQLVESDEDEV